MSFHRGQFDDAGKLFDLASKILVFVLFLSNLITFIKTILVGDLAGQIVIGIIMAVTLGIFAYASRKRTITQDVLSSIELNEAPNIDMWWRKYSHPFSNRSGYPAKRPQEGKYSVNGIDPLPVMMPYKTDFRWSVGLKTDPEHVEQAPNEDPVRSPIPADPVPFEKSIKEHFGQDNPEQATFSVRHPQITTETIRH